MPVTIRELAEKLNLSKGTVSRVLNGHEDPFISVATRARVLKVASEVGYQPNRNARALATGRTHMVAFCTGYLDNLSSVAINKVQGHVRDHHLDLLVSAMLTEGTLPTQEAKPPAPIQVDGILVFECPQYVRALLDGPFRADIPIVNMGVYHVPSTDYVAVDIYEPSRQAVQHLIDSGCKRVVFATRDFVLEREEARYRAYLSVMEDAGYAPEILAMPDRSRATARQRIRLYVENEGTPDGIFCMDDELAIGIYRGLRDLGVRIPDDVALVGVNGQEDGEYLDPALTTVAFPLAEVCETAWRFLSQRMEHPDLPQQQAVVPSRLLIRESSCRRE